MSTVEYNIDLGGFQTPPPIVPTVSTTSVKPLHRIGQYAKSRASRFAQSLAGWACRCKMCAIRSTRQPTCGYRR